MRPSSIFSSESRPRLGKVPWGLVVCLAWLLALELAVSRRDFVWKHIPFTDVGVVDALEEKVLAPLEALGPEPKVLLFGNSRTRDAFAPRLLEAQLGLDEGQVLNLALTRGTAYDAEILYRRHRPWLSRAEVAVFGVDVIQLDGKLEANERVRRFAPLADRLRLFSGEERARLIAGWLWRSLDAKDALRRYLKSMWVEAPREIPISADGRVEWRTKAMNRRASRRPMRAYAKQHFAHFERDPKARARLRRFVALLESDGVEVIIVQVPVRERYAGLARRRYLDRMGAYEDEVLAAVGDRPHILWWDAGFAGLRDVDFHDYGHVRDSGARKLSRRLASWIWERYGARLAAADEEAPEAASPAKASRGPDPVKRD